MKANQTSFILLALFSVLSLAGCRRGPDIVTFDKVVYDIPALSTMTYDQAQQKLGAPFNTKTGRAVRGVVRTVDWVTPNQTMGLTGSYDEGTGLPFALSFYLNGTLSTQEELRKATNLQQPEILRTATGTLPASYSCVYKLLKWRTKRMTSTINIKVKTSWGMNELRIKNKR
jgi:hypothetical protein